MDRPSAASAAAARCGVSRMRACWPAPAGSPTTFARRRRPICRFLRSPHAHARIVSIDTDGGAGDARRARRLHRRRARRRRRQADAGGADVHAPDGTPRRDAAAPRAGARDRALRRRGGRRRGRRDAASRRSDAAEADRGRVRRAAGGRRPTCAGDAPGAPLVCAEAPGNIAAEMRHGDAAPRPTPPSTRAAHVVSLDLVNQRVAPTPMEPRTALAELRRRSAAG